MKLNFDYQNIYPDLIKQNYFEIPISISQKILNQAAKYFLDFLKSPQNLKDNFTIMADDEDRGSESGYAIRKKEKGRSDNKEYFNYRGITETLLSAHIQKNINNPLVTNFLDAARFIYKESLETLGEIMKFLDTRCPGIYEKVFVRNPDRLLCLRFVKYDLATKGDFLAKPHYDRGFCALALAESSPGLRVGKNDANLKEIARHGNTAIFMPAFTFARDIGSNEFTPAWHDVVQKSENAYSNTVARWAIILFADIHSDNSISYGDTHIPKY